MNLQGKLILLFISQIFGRVTSAPSHMQEVLSVLCTARVSIVMLLVGRRLRVMFIHGGYQLVSSHELEK